MSTPEIWATAAFVVLCLVSYLIYGATSADHLHDTNGGEVVSLLDLRAKSQLSRGACHVVLIRQSGNLHRDLGTFPSVDAAIAEASKSFRRAGVDTVRVTYNDPSRMAVYRQIYNFRGRAEGKKFAGAQFRIVNYEAEKPIDFLEFNLKKATHKGGTNWQVQFDYRCKKCGGEKIEVPDEKADNSPVYCIACGHVFGTFSELWSLSNLKAQEHVARLEVERGELKND